MINMGMRRLKRNKYYKWYVAFFFGMGLISTIVLFVVNWKIALCIFFLTWANNAFHSSLV